MTSIDIIIIYCNEERLAFMKTQMSQLHLPFNITYFKAFTPDDSVDWIAASSPASPKLQCCFRSHIDAMYSWHNRPKRAEYLLILEDDVCLLKTGIEARLQGVIETYKHMSDIDYVSIGYLPCVKDGTVHEYVHKTLGRDAETIMYWNFSKADFTIWGSQAQLFSAACILNITELLRTPSANEIYTKVPTHLLSHKCHQKKAIHPTIDALLPLLFSQAIVCPPLAIENSGPSSIHGHHVTRENVWKLAETKGMLRLGNYYSYQ